MRPKLVHEVASKQLTSYSSACMATTCATFTMSCPSTHTNPKQYTTQHIKTIESCLRLASPLRTVPHKRLAEILAHRGAIHCLRKIHHHVQDKHRLHTKWGQTCTTALEVSFSARAALYFSDSSLISSRTLQCRHATVQAMPEEDGAYPALSLQATIQILVLIQLSICFQYSLATVADIVKPTDEHLSVR